MALKFLSKWISIARLFIISYLSYFLLLLISSLSDYTAKLVSCLLFIYIGSIYSKKRYNQTEVLMITFAFNNLIMYHILTSAYAEALPWEELLHFLLYVAVFYFFIKHRSFKPLNNDLIITKE